MKDVLIVVLFLATLLAGGWAYHAGQMQPVIVQQVAPAACPVCPACPPTPAPKTIHAPPGQPPISPALVLDIIRACETGTLKFDGPFAIIDKVR